jgi:hypothetical protein
VVVDFRAMARRAVALIRSARSQRQVDQTLERLKQQRAKLRERLSPRKADGLASRRYEASSEAKGELPVTKMDEPVKPEPKKKPEKAAPKKAAPQSSHIDRLLKAKQKTKDRKTDEGKRG